MLPIGLLRRNVPFVLAASDSHILRRHKLDVEDVDSRDDDRCKITTAGPLRVLGLAASMANERNDDHAMKKKVFNNMIDAF